MGPWQAFSVAKRAALVAARVIRLPKSQKRFLSFTNLVEVHVLAAIRRKHALGLDAIRRAVRYVHEELDVDHPLVREQFKTNGVDLFVERLGKIINASRDGQFGMKPSSWAPSIESNTTEKGAVRLFRCCEGRTRRRISLSIRDGRSDVPC